MLAIISLLLALVIGASFYLKWKHSYWSRRGVPYMEPEFFFGNFKKASLGKMLPSEVIVKAYYEFKSIGAKFGGIYFAYTPIWIPLDTALIKQLLQKDYWNFAGRGNFYHHKNDILTNHLAFSEGAGWKSLRAKLSPAFSSGKVKNMFHIIDRVGDQAESIVMDLCKRNQPLSIKEVQACFSIDVIASCAFGIDSNSLDNPNNELRQHSRKLFTPNFLSRLLEQFVNWDVLNFLGYSGLGKDADNFFVKLISDMINYRDKNNVTRQDFLQLMLNLRQKENTADGNEKNVLARDEVISNSFLLYGAGSGTVSSNMSFLMYEMARHPEIQEKARREIWEVCKYDPEYKVTYEDLHNLKYCDMIINETLRIHTSVTEVRRMCTTDYQVPGTNVTIQKGTFVLIPIWALHNDPDYYENPKEFNPENFGEEKKADRKNAPFFPFGEGIRSCIGMRFALIQMKLAMVKYLKHFKYELNSKTPKDIQYEASPVAIEPKGNVLFDIKKVDIENYI
ncbi:cytochrome P450 6A1-like [Dendroctonus ponderosae]|uniref:Cytochrome P450 CYP6DK1 n=2 Tax=Dendroctonus ponderosae TaxID=77166 RepID=I1VJ58_DENPD|nr:cytochrome P450 6A1-like [Dendroctonus ponderosae]AFI45042.1 cytochrome P450 CYP6DK1 [Dendroctonus ponderosae]ERL89378.1 hypothetical protein D910_06749 [Dendroctonus ponderosae]KAH1027858.1 hypothetical protein HUJ05_001289 [Dendroctonus ponderosae]